jgi:hypothetical protein
VIWPVVPGFLAGPGPPVPGVREHAGAPTACGAGGSIAGDPMAEPGAQVLGARVGEPIKDEQGFAPCSLASASVPGGRKGAREELALTTSFIWDTGSNLADRGWAQCVPPPVGAGTSDARMAGAGRVGSRW